MSSTPPAPEAWGAGLNFYGQIDPSKASPSKWSSLAPLPFLSGSGSGSGSGGGAPLGGGVAQLAAGGHFTVLVGRDGAVYRWGVDNGVVYDVTPCRLEMPSPTMRVRTAACGRHHTVALTEGG